MAVSARVRVALLFVCTLNLILTVHSDAQVEDASVDTLSQASSSDQQESEDDESFLSYLLAIGILMAALFILREGFSPSVPYVPPKPKSDRKLERPADPNRLFTKEELLKYDGSDPTSPIYISCKGIVFDVTEGGFYDLGDAYATFSGRDGSKGFATMDLEDASELQSYDDLDNFEKDTLQEWFDKFDWKYVRVGKLQDSPLIDENNNMKPLRPFKPFDKMKELMKEEAEKKESQNENAEGRTEEGKSFSRIQQKIAEMSTPVDPETLKKLTQRKGATSK